MILDQSIRFSNAQAITGTAVSTDVIDTGAAHDEGLGQPFHINVQTVAALTGGTSLAVAVETSSDNTTFVEVLRTAPVLTAALTANTVIAQLDMPNGLRRYVRLNYVVAGTFGAGTVNADIALDIHRAPTYATSFTVA